MQCEGVRVDMRWFLLFFFLGSLGLCAGGPSEAALKTLRIFQSEKTVSLDEVLKISPYCGPSKKKLIERRWNDLSVWLQENNFQLSELDEKVDGDLAVSLVGLIHESNPELTSVLSLSLVKEAEDWLVAPILGSFENTGIGFEASVLARAESLQRWVMKEKVGQLVKLRKSEQERFRESLEGAIAEDILSQQDPEQVLLEFLDAVYSGDVKKVLVWQGALERDELLEWDWEQNVAATHLGMATTREKSAWQLLRSKSVLKVLIDEDGDADTAKYLYSFLSVVKPNPRSNDVTAVRFSLKKTSRGWRVKLPAIFAYDHEEEFLHREKSNDESDWEDRNNARKLATFFEAENEALHGDSAEDLLKEVVLDLKAGTLPRFMQRHLRVKSKKRKKDDDDDELIVEDEEVLSARRMQRFLTAVKWWGKTLAGDGVQEPTIEHLIEKEDLALGVLMMPPLPDRWKPELRVVWMGLEDDGWVILPGDPSPSNRTLSPDLVKTHEQILKEYKKWTEQEKEGYLAELKSSIVIADLDGETVEKDVAVELVEKWRKVALNGTVHDVIKLSAVRKAPEKMSLLLDDLNYIRKGVVAASVPDEVLDSKGFGSLCGVSLSIAMGRGVDRGFPMMIVVPTEKGPRVLIDIELSYESNKGVEIMNKDVLDGLSEEMAKGDYEQILAMYDWHQEVAGKSFKKWQVEKAKTKK